MVDIANVSLVTCDLMFTHFRLYLSAGALCHVLTDNR